VSVSRRKPPRRFRVAVSFSKVIRVISCPLGPHEDPEPEARSANGRLYACYTGVIPAVLAVVVPGEGDSFDPEAVGPRDSTTGLIVVS
jgi:hypothetical protein